MVNEPRALDRTPVVNCLFKGVEHEARMRCLVYSPADDAARAGVAE